MSISDKTWQIFDELIIFQFEPFLIIQDHEVFLHLLGLIKENTDT